MIREFKKDELTIKVLKDRSLMGEIAAKDAANVIRELFKSKADLNIIFAAAPSQKDFLKSLLTQEIDWSRINAFHMDEYVGLPPNAPQGFANFLKENIFSKVLFKSINYLNGNTVNYESELLRYTEALKKSPVDIVFMGIGENTHIAFNDPHVADFNDSKSVKIVDLDLACRQQQVNDGCFTQISDVPTHAITLTIPTLMNAKHIFCIVPSKNKASAVYLTLNEKIQSVYPSTILRNHKQATLYVDTEAASLLNQPLEIIS